MRSKMSQRGLQCDQHTVKYSLRLRGSRGPSRDSAVGFNAPAHCGRILCAYARKSSRMSTDISAKQRVRRRLAGCVSSSPLCWYRSGVRRQEAGA
jgi:hypothetical protein